MINYSKVLARQLLVRVMHRRTAARNRMEVSKGGISRILVIRPDHLGDLLFATPSLEIIRQAFPEARITGAVGPWGRAMWEGNPALDALITIPFPGIARGSREGALAPYKLLGYTASRLSKEQYDLGIVLRFDHWWGAALMWAAGVPRRWGYGTPGVRAWLTDGVAYVSGRHEVEQNIRLVEAVSRHVGARRASHASLRSVPLHAARDKGTPSLTASTPIPLSNADKLLGEWLSAPRRAVIHPGTGAANKLWTITGWAEVTNRLREQGWAVALTGSPTEYALTGAIMNVGAGAALPTPDDAPPLLNVAGKTANLGELAWVLDKAQMVLGVDSGPLHIAAALGKPTLHLYGPTDETIWGPWGDPRKHRPLRAPGTHPTMHLDVNSHELEGGPEMRAITPELVMAEAAELMRET